jgi:nucleoside-diphosphate-sugar epimerase
MFVMVTGNLGYIGSVLTPILASRNYKVRGYDCGYFEQCLISDAETPEHQITKDIRDVERRDLNDVDSVIHLAALSNDPLGQLDESLTESINYEGTMRLASVAKMAGVSRFVYASSQSMYGISDIDVELDEDASEKLPLTAYAKTKWQAEQELMALRAPGFEVTAFRPSTVYGVSPRLRCDIVFNFFVACAHTTGLIEVRSDGSPCRPVVHIRDVCDAFIAGLEAEAALVDGRAFNVGVSGGNYSVMEIALAARDAVSGSQLVFTGEHGSDSRTYKVKFERILTELNTYYQPRWDLEKGGRELSTAMSELNFTESDFRTRCNRLAKLNELIEEGRVDESLRMVRT